MHNVARASHGIFHHTKYMHVWCVRLLYFRKVVQNFELKRVGGAPKGHPLAPLFAHIINFKGILDFLSRKIKNYQACILTLSESCLWELQEIIHSEKSEVLRSNQFHLFSWQLVIWGLKASIEKVCCFCVFGCYSYTSLLNICSIISIDFLITSSPQKRRRFVCLVAGSTRTIPRKFKFL